MTVPSLFTASLLLLPGSHGPRTPALSTSHVSYTLLGETNTSHGYPQHFGELHGKGEAFPGATTAWSLAAPCVTQHPCCIPNTCWPGSSEQLLLTDLGLDPWGPAAGMQPSQTPSAHGHWCSLHSRPSMRVIPQIPNAASKQIIVPLCLTLRQPQMPAHNSTSCCLCCF